MEPACLSREAVGLVFAHKDKVAIRTTVVQDLHQFLRIVLVSAVVVITIGFIPHHKYDCRCFTLWWVFISGHTVTNMYPLVLA